MKNKRSSKSPSADRFVYQTTIELQGDLPHAVLVKINGIRNGLVDGLLGDRSIIDGLNALGRACGLSHDGAALEMYARPSDRDLEDDVRRLIATRLQFPEWLCLPGLLWARFWHERDDLLKDPRNTFRSWVTMGDGPYRDALRALATSPDLSIVMQPALYQEWIEARLRSQYRRMPKRHGALTRRHAQWWYEVQIQHRSKNQIAERDEIAWGTVHAGVQKISKVYAFLRPA